MKALINGVTREMTSDEITEWENAIEDTSAFPKEPTQEERITALEATTDDMILMMAELIGGE